jgi:hypothetical protein
MKRFSWLSFILAGLLHLYGTSLLFGAAMQEERATRYGAPSQHAVELTVWTWVWLPLPMLLKPLFEHHGPPSHEGLPKPHRQYFIYIVVSWSLVVGTFCGFLDPCISRRQRRIA